MTLQTLKQVREARGVSKIAMARHLGITDKTYAVYEKNPKRMRIGVAKEAAKFLGCDIGDIFFA
ncbi:helix-turn-helix transcriptional regulator [Slackia exigua]|uniref:helix-turn-helix transcriptional regulator n=1 Tax=Slackia exigua TaxID=84109 RepID=UPI0023F4A8DC|nr:helix-turn-helix transcriptional regulator [Slackia exigua]